MDKENLNVMIVGGGGREHALAWKARQSPRVDNLYIAPGNAGTLKVGQNVEIEAENIGELSSFAQTHNIGLTIVGPEVPLARGIVDEFESHGLRIFGPNRAAARLESSKVYATEFMRRNHILHPETRIATSAQEAKMLIDDFKGAPVVIKADGLAAGKGVIVPDNEREAKEAVDKLIDELGEAASKILIQQRLFGQEVSVMAISDGEKIFPFIPAQDYKRLNTGDTGPNTGGIGAFAPSNLSKDALSYIQNEILVPTIQGMDRRGIPFKGVLYAGLMIAGGNIYNLEYNVRMGDPETEPLMLLLESDIIDLAEASIDSELNEWSLSFRRGGAVCVVLASSGYPGKPLIGDKIEGLESVGNGNIQVFHAGTKLENGEVVTSGGRVLDVTALGNSVETARLNAYSKIGLDGIHFKGMQYRIDIALRR